MSINIGVNIQRSPNRINQALRAAGVNGQYPKLLFDFDDEYYLTNGSSKTFANAMTFARAGNATMTDSDGLIKWAPHNLLVYSEDLTNTWAGGGVTATDSTITSDTSTGLHHLTQGVSADAGTYTFKVELKANGYNYAVVRLVNDNFSSDRYGILIDLTDGTFVDDTVTGSPITSYSISDIGDGWYQLTVSMNHNTGSFFASVSMNDDATPTWSAGLTLFTGDGSSGIQARRMHLYRSDLGGMVNNPDRGDSYVPTTSSAVYLPRRGHHKYNGDQWVKKGILVESEARTNLVEASSDFSDSYWINVTTTVTTNSVLDPAGLTEADTLLGASSFARMAAPDSGLSDNTNYVFSVYAKQGSATYFGMLLKNRANVSVSCVFYLDTGTATGDGIIENVGNGWYRCSLVMNMESGATTPDLRFVNYSSGGWGDGETIYVYGAQIEAGSTPSSYIPTNGATVTRAAESITVPYANLPWPTHTYIGDELVTNGTFDTDSNWTLPTGFSIGSGVMSYDGTGSAFTYAVQPVITTVGKVYAIDFDTTAISGSVAFGVYKDATLLKIIGSVGHTTVFFVATGTSTNIIFKTQYIPTQTFSIDNVSVREINPLSVSIAMKGEMNYADEDENIQIIFYQWKVDSNNEISGYISTSTTRTGKGVFRQIDNGILDVSVTGDNYYSPDILVPYNISGRHGSTFINGAVEGIALTANTTPVALPDLSTTNLDLAYDYMGTISEFRIWDRDLGDTGIAEATKPSLEPSLSLTFDGQPSSFTNSGLTV